MTEQLTPTLRLAGIQDTDAVLKLIRSFWNKTPYTEYEYSEARIKFILEKFIIDRHNGIVLVSVDKDDPSVIVGAIIGHKMQPAFSYDWTAVELFWFVKDVPDKREREIELVKAYQKWAELVGCKFAQYARLHLKEPEQVEEPRRGFRVIETNLMKRLS